jgi:hypothetical protein
MMGTVMPEPVGKTVEVTTSVLKVGEATTKTRDAMSGTPATLGWLNLSVYVPGAMLLPVTLGHSKPEYVVEAPATGPIEAGARIEHVVVPPVLTMMGVIA